MVAGGRATGAFSRALTLCRACRLQWVVLVPLTRRGSDRITRAAALAGRLRKRLRALRWACASPKAGALTKLRHVP